MWGRASPTYRKRGGGQRLGWLGREALGQQQGVALLQAYPILALTVARRPTLFEIFCAAQTDKMFRIPQTVSPKPRQRTRPSVHVPLWTWRSPVANGFLGACHALEIPFVFGTTVSPSTPQVRGPRRTRWQRQWETPGVGLRAQRDPTTDALPWPAFDAEHRRTMVLGKGFSVEETPRERSVATGTASSPKGCNP